MTWLTDDELIQLSQANSNFKTGQAIIAGALTLCLGLSIGSLIIILTLM